MRHMLTADNLTGAIPKGCAFRWLNFNHLHFDSNQESNLKDPEAYLCMLMVEVSEPFPHSGLISQTTPAEHPLRAGV